MGGVMCRWLTLAALGALVLGLAAAGAPIAAAPGEGGPGESRPGSQVLGDGVIVPGQRVGPIRLSMTMDQIIETAGPRYRRDEFPREGIILYEWRAEGLWVSQVLSTRAIRLISAFGASDGYRTDKGVALLHPRARMEEVYGRQYRVYDYPEDRITLVRYPDLGLQFGLVNQPSNPVAHGRIFQIGVFKPGDLPPLKKPAP
jgi:hypothetical protein